MLSPEDVDPEIVANALEAMEITAPDNYQAMDLEDIARIILASASERLGRRLERMRDRRNEARGMAKELGQQLATATAEIDRLTGERDRYERTLREIAARCACGPSSHGCSSVIARRALEPR